jgi:hypothetical protein
MRKMRETKDFDKILLEAIDEGLKVLGESGKHMVFYYLERTYSIRKHDIPKNPEAFVNGLERIFGSGASVLEKMILKCIYSKLGLKDGKIEGQTLTDCIKEAAVTITQPSENLREQNGDYGFKSQTIESNPVSNETNFVLTTTL